MKRYRVPSLDHDDRAHQLAMKIKDDWPPKERNVHIKARDEVLAGLRAELGEASFASKVENFVDLGPAPMSVVAFHNAPFRQARTAFAMGCYYPALMAVSALGGRVLYHLIRKLREDYKTTPEYAEVSKKRTFTKWEIPIHALEAWGVLLPATATLFRELCHIRKRSIHVDFNIERDVRLNALEAIRIFQQIIWEQFASFGPPPWYIRTGIGVSLIRKDHEAHPFVKRIVLPNSVHVGPAHKMSPLADGTWRVIDRDDYPSEDIDDAEYVRRFKEAHGITA